ncbi:ABATE domain-containing protein [Anaeromyxobacter sp. PSR-1]|uniref:CGNR zinc finger domain-containing protein n=1 Tax=Anaeromyxobacter sp. PSR-1 TaxID=1300915 RepID=UPI0005E41913|nr:ABATE domain-containing protein [Anaeromyxobacter sp. PSR-1]GAO01747.1 CGNR zinc finger [Anaeromyxobacter sp. PSR-1]
MDPRPLLVGSHPAADFLNTTVSTADGPVERLVDGRALLDWLVAVGLLEAPAAAAARARWPAADLDRVAAEARRLRERARRVLEDWRAGRALRPGRLLPLNALLERGSAHRALALRGGRWTLVERARLDAPAQLLVPVAQALAALLADEEPERVRSCAGAGCTLWFVDRTRSGRRRFCSAELCGNRARVAAYRQRHGRGG